MPVGRPLSPGSVAGVKRRSKRRTARAVTPGPGAAPARRGRR